MKQKKTNKDSTKKNLLYNLRLCFLMFLDLSQKKEERFE